MTILDNHEYVKRAKYLSRRRPQNKSEKPTKQLISIKPRKTNTGGGKGKHQR